MFAVLSSRDIHHVLYLHAAAMKERFETCRRELSDAMQVLSANNAIGLMVARNELSDLSKDLDNTKFELEGELQHQFMEIQRLVRASHVTHQCKIG